MTAAQVLACLSKARIEVRAEGGTIYCRPRAAVTPGLQAEIRQHKQELVRLLTEPEPVGLTCPACHRIDYLPLVGGWRRCWRCGRRWGPETRLPTRATRPT